MDGVTLERVRALGTHSATRASCSITGIPGFSVLNVRLKDCYFEMPGGVNTVPALPGELENGYPQSNIFGNTPGYALFIRHAQGVVLDNVTVGRTKPDARPWLSKEDATVQEIGCIDLGEVRALPISK